MNTGRFLQRKRSAVCEKFVDGARFFAAFVSHSSFAAGAGHGPSFVVSQPLPGEAIIVHRVVRRCRLLHQIIIPAQKIQHLRQPTPAIHVRIVYRCKGQHDGRKYKDEEHLSFHVGCLVVDASMKDNV